MPGFPIRTPSDHSSVDSSPRTIAASHVLHRLLMPRHPPCALDNLTNTPANITKKQFKQNCCWKNSNREQDARVHCTILNDHTDHPDPRPRREPAMTAPEKTHPHPQQTRPAIKAGPTPRRRGRLSSQDPTVRLVRCFHIFSSNPTRLPNHNSPHTWRKPQAGTGEALHPDTGRGRGHSPRRSHPAPGVR